MKRYWDYTESERAKLTEEQIEPLLAYELMERGVLGVTPLVLEDVAPVKLPASRVYMLVESDSYGNGTSTLGIGFANVEAAEECRNRIGYVLEHSWNEPPHVRPPRSIRVVADDLPTSEAVATSKAAITEQKRREEANKAAIHKHEEACKAASDATSGIWSDWAACRETEAHNQRIRDTLAEYLRLTDGNTIMARVFLAKAFPPGEIAEALGETASPAEDVAPAPVPVPMGIEELF
jgi:hypothetical protein